jgi:hypothetical protein
MHSTAKHLSKLIQITAMEQTIQSDPTGKELTATARQNLVENLKKVRTEAWAEYMETSRQAWNEFQAVIRAAREEYLMVRQSDRDELRRELSVIEDEFEKSWRTALHEYKADTFGDFRGLALPAFEEHVPERVIELHPWHREIVVSQPSEHRYMVVSHPHGYREIISYPGHREIIVSHPYGHTEEVVSYPWHIEEVVFHPWHRERSWARYKRAEQDAANECRHLRRATAQEYLLREREAWVRYQNFRQTIWSHYRKIVQDAFEKYQAKYADAREEVLRSY